MANNSILSVLAGIKKSFKTIFASNNNHVLFLMGVFMAVNMFVLLAVENGFDFSGFNCVITHNVIVDSKFIESMCEFQISANLIAFENNWENMDETKVSMKTDQATLPWHGLETHILLFIFYFLVVSISFLTTLILYCDQKDKGQLEDWIEKDRNQVDRPNEGSQNHALEDLKAAYKDYELKYDLGRLDDGGLNSQLMNRQTQVLSNPKILETSLKIVFWQYFIGIICIMTCWALVAFFFGGVTIEEKFKFAFMINYIPLISSYQAHTSKEIPCSMLCAAEVNMIYEFNNVKSEIVSHCYKNRNIVIFYGLFVYKVTSIVMITLLFAIFLFFELKKSHLVPEMIKRAITIFTKQQK